jgi:hypothetical protein
MEVHAHTHTARKKWTHYFWEFFMLFMAVSAGFLVENQREHYIEHQREKKFAALLYEDLKNDSAFINVTIAIKEQRHRKMDSLFYFLDSTDLQQHAKEIYYYTGVIEIDLIFKPNDATFQQLKNSGSLRFFNNYELYNRISNYYAHCQFYLDQESSVYPKVPTGLLSKLFDAKGRNKLVSVTPDILNAGHFPTEPLKLRTSDNETVNELENYVVNAKTTLEIALMLLKGGKKELYYLMRELKKEYDLKD